MQPLSPYIIGGSRMVCTNYREISVMGIVWKVFARVLNERVKVRTVDKVMDEQRGFRTGRGCVDQTWKRLMIVKLWMVLEEYGVEGKLFRAIQALYDRGMACVKVGQRKSEMFHVCKGVRQHKQ